jgi:hypothetical protein
LRLLASAAPPEGLADRVHRRLRAESAAPRRAWFSFLTIPQVGYAAAGVLVAALAGGSWGLYQVNQINRAPAIVAPPHPGAPGGFGTSHVAHVPPTLAPLHVPPVPNSVPKKKASAGKTAARGKKAGGSDTPQPALQAPVQP